jgi:hypothetical protein
MFATISRYIVKFFYFIARQDSSETFNLLEFRSRNNRGDLENLKKLNFPFI